MRQQVPLEVLQLATWLSIKNVGIEGYKKGCVKVEAAVTCSDNDYSKSRMNFITTYPTPTMQTYSVVICWASIVGLVHLCHTMRVNKNPK
jgi:hypothetical protein